MGKLKKQVLKMFAKDKKIILKVKNLTVKLDKEEIIKNLSFEVKEGQVLTILGPNGAGKTVLLKTLLGILPYNGKIEWKINVKIGYVPQRVPFVKQIPISVREFFLLKTTKEEAEKILDKIGFEKRILEKRLGDLSSGQFQRILVAWALVKNPNILLFDEPMTGIDVKGKETIYSLLLKLKKERNLTILLVTHDLNIVFKISDYVICLNKYCMCRGPPIKNVTPKTLQKLYGSKIKFYAHK